MICFMFAALAHRPYVACHVDRLSSTREWDSELAHAEEGNLPEPGNAADARDIGEEAEGVGSAQVGRSAGTCPR